MAMPHFVIWTSGPCPTIVAADVPAAKAYVEAHAPLKRGWTFKWVAHESLTDWTLRRINSKGNDVGNQYAITLSLQEAPDEVRCLKCGETFIPDDLDDLTHIQTESEVECGGRADGDSFVFRYGKDGPKEAHRVVMKIGRKR